MEQRSRDPETPRERMARLVRIQADACAELGSPFYAVLMRHAADDVLAGGVVAEVLAGHEHDPGPSALALRLFGAVHRMVLSGEAPGLTPYYGSVGGTPDPERAWPVLRRLLDERRVDLRQGLAHPPQTNEVGRAAALLGGLLHATAAFPLPVRLHEVGASAGLSLRVDHIRVEPGDGRILGPADSPVVLRNCWEGTPPPDASLRVVERAGSDVAPVDPTTAEGRLLLTSFVWPDDTARLARLRGAFEIAARVPAPVVHSSAAEHLAGLDVRPGTLLVVWHSVMRQYLPQDEREAMAMHLSRLADAASEAAPFAHVALEPRRPDPSEPARFLVFLRLAPGGDERVIGEAAPHGVPVRWNSPETKDRTSVL